MATNDLLLLTRRVDRLSAMMQTLTFGLSKIAKANQDMSKRLAEIDAEYYRMCAEIGITELTEGKHTEAIEDSPPDGELTVGDVRLILQLFCKIRYNPAKATVLNNSAVLPSVFTIRDHLIDGTRNIHFNQGVVYTLKHFENICSRVLKSNAETESITCKIKSRISELAYNISGSDEFSQTNKNILSIINTEEGNLQYIIRCDRTVEIVFPNTDKNTVYIMLSAAVNRFMQGKSASEV